MDQPGPSDRQEKDHLARLIEKQQEELDVIEGKIELWTKYRDDYKDLKKLLLNLPNKVRHPHKIPIAGSKLALVDGHIIHTNEISVLLGDQLFAVRSAKQASQIVDRRLNHVNDMMKLSEDTKKKITDWLKVTREHQEQKEDFVEIIETM